MPGGLRFAPAPPNVSCVPAERELVSVGPLPLYLSGGGQAPGHPIPLPEASGGVYFICFRKLVGNRFGSDRMCQRLNPGIFPEIMGRKHPIKYSNGY